LTNTSKLFRRSTSRFKAAKKEEESKINPLFEMLFMRMAFLSWENYTKKFVNPETKEIDMEAVNADESDEEDYEYVVDQV